jgi:hypothetical protein
MFAALLLVITSPPLRAATTNTPMSVYTDSLQTGWQNWSWATVNLAATSPVHSGTKSIAITMYAWSGFYLHLDAFDSTPYAALTFWINGGATGGQSIQLQATLSGQPQTAYPIGPLKANTWTQVTVPLSALGVDVRPDLDGFWLQDVTGGNQSVFYVDDISLTASNTPPPPPVPAVVNVDAAAGRHAINPLIYGVAYGDSTTLADLNAPLNRQGGNNTSRYNWQLNADNRGSDWYFESIGDDSALPGERGDTFISQSKAAGADAMLTIPMLPWVAKLGPGRAKLASFTVSKYGAQQYTDYWMPDAGNGVRVDGSSITGNNPSDANVASTPDFQAGWVNHIVSKWGTAGAGGLRYYIMDNEPSIWFGTHRDVHPTGPTMDEIKNDIVAYAGKVKAIDPGAQVVGPEEWGWSGYFYSGYDQQWGSSHGWSGYPDRAAHADADYLPWLLQQMAAAEKSAGKRLLDVFSVHFYPQSGEFGDDVSSTMQMRRNRSTRQLWDPSYVSESWIGEKVQLIPRIKGWVNQYYPGTKTAITEYNWGAENHINGATTQADIYGIFGREGLDLATRWTTPDPSTPTYLAMKMYRNYDGTKSTFGETSVSAAVTNPDALSSFAAVRQSDGALTVMVVNKALTGSTQLNLNISNFAGAALAQAWQLSSKNKIERLADVAVSTGAISTALPSQTVTLFVIPATASTPSPTPTPTLASLTPAKIGAGSAATTITVTGAGFTGTGTVKWNGSSIPTTFVSSSTLKATVSATLLSVPGSAKVTVAQGGVSSNAVAYTIANVRPPVTSWGLTSSAPTGTNGWYRGPVTLTLMANDPDGASDVATIVYRVDSAALAPYTTPVVISNDKRHIITGHATDSAGNVEGTWTLPLNIDSNGPVVGFSAKSPLQNAAGWNKSAVTITVNAADTNSGLASVSASTLLITTEGRGQTRTVTATDNAGNTTARSTPLVNIDLTPPSTTMTVSGSRVTLKAVDVLSGVASITYTLDGVSSAYTTPFTVTTKGTHTLTYQSTDKAGNVEVLKTATINL